MIVTDVTKKTSNKAEISENLTAKCSQPIKNSNYAWSFGGKTKMDMPECFSSNSRRTIIIKSALDNQQKIGVQLNTNVHIKERRRWDHRDLITAALFCLLICQFIVTYLQSQHLRSELEVTKQQVDILTENLLSANKLCETVNKKLKDRENTSHGDYVQTGPMHIMNKRDVEEQIMNHTTRQARSVGRGKHSHCKNRSGCRCRCYETSGPFAVHLRGALPEITVRDGGIVAPWYIDKTSSGIFVLADGVVGDGKGIVEIVEEGLYFIYAQMYYLTSSSLNSYAINLQLGEGRGREDMVIAACSAEAATNKLSELSCYTAVVRYLQQGDRIFITQRERNRRIVFRDNKSFLGLTLLNSPHR